MSGWKECRLGDVATVRGGKRLPKGKMLTTLQTSHPYIRITDFDGHKILPDNIQYVEDETQKTIARYTVEAGDLIISIVGTLGLCAIIPKQLDKANLTENCANIHIKGENADRLFLYYQLISPDTQATIAGFDVGSTQPKLPLYNIENISLIIPPLPEQQAIAGVLSSLDNKIDLLHRQNKTLEGMAAALWQKMFVEEAKTEWEIIPFGKLAELQRGISYHGNQLAEEGNGTPMHNLNSVDISGSYKYEGIKFYAGEIKGKQRLRAGDLLIVNTDITQNNRIIGWPIFVPDSFVESTFTHHLYSVTLQNDKISKLYLFFLLRYRDYRERLASSANGTTVSMLPKEAIYNLEISIPPVDKRKEFEETVSEILNKQSLNHIQIKTIHQLRDKLLPKLMSGEVRVKQ